MHRRVLYRENGKFYILDGKTQPNGKIEVMLFSVRNSKIPYNEATNPFNIPSRKIDWKKGELIGIYATEEETNDQMDYYLESTWIVSENRRAYADT